MTRTFSSVFAQSIQVTLFDKVIFAAALSLVVYLYFLLWQPHALGYQILVYVGEKYWGSVDPYINQTLDIEGEIGVSRLQVDEGKIRFVESPCTTKQCIYQGWQQHAGDAAACLPNRVSIRLQGPDPRFDTLNF